jgi:hypothetical protein
MLWSGQARAWRRRDRAGCRIERGPQLVQVGSDDGMQARVHAPDALGHPPDLPVIPAALGAEPESRIVPGKPLKLAVGS